MARRPAVAGMFYESDKNKLIRSIEECFTGKFGPGKLPRTDKNGPRNIVGLVCPHAGYIYSGGAAAHSYAALAEDGLPEVAVIIGPNHHGMGPAVAVSATDSWEIPLGSVSVDQDAANTIAELSTYAQLDDTAHMREHSIEVQLPFLHYIYGNAVKVLPIAISYLNISESLLLIDDLASAIARSINGKQAVIIASTDFSHYESKSVAEAKDALALSRIEDMDAQGLIEVVHNEQINMCGVAGTAVMLETCKTLGATSAKKLTYYTSGDITGDTRQVVGYAAVKIMK